MLRDLFEWIILKLQEKMKSGELTLCQLAGLYLEQIDSIDQGALCELSD